MNIEKHKEEFLKNEIMWLVFQSALVVRGRRPYHVCRQDPRVSEEDKRRFKEDITDRLEKLSVKYLGASATDDGHTDDIKILQDEISTKWSEVLFPHENAKGGWLTFGRAQKLVNLYLKYRWIFDCEKVLNPPHCPLDSIILRKIKWSGPSWTDPKFTKEKYIEAVGKCRKKAKEEGFEDDIAAWELKVFNDR